ncbi:MULTISPECIES: 50S ribosomal protein L14 [unclassified Spiroplasma]|uniref:50S ribosomal protein L14 n=1 Tax=unclassified Spiroplasma TaxID=2637901 RepID=UPI0030CAEBB0
MLQNLSWANVADNTGIKEVMVIRVLGGSTKKFVKIGDIVVCSAKSVTPNSAMKKGQVVKAVVVRSKFGVKRNDGSCVKFDDNAVVIIKEDKTPRGTRVFGVLAREVKERGYNKIASLAEEIV